MRILLAHPLPLGVTATGRYTRQLALALAAQGHRVRTLIADEPAPPTADELPIARVVCGQVEGADAQLPLPYFSDEARSAQTFDGLSDNQLSEYREAYRARLDHEVDTFDPEIIHAQHVWLPAQLALESGVPYVVSAWGAELSSLASPRLGDLAAQAAENASRIVAPTATIARAVQQQFDLGSESSVLMPPAVAPPQAAGSRPELLAALGLPATLGPVVAALFDPPPASGLDVLLNAAARYESDPHALATVICGAGPGLDELQALAARLGLSRVHFVPLTHPERLSQLFQLAEVAVFPRRVLSGGIDPAWALAAGTPVVVGTASGIDWLASYAAARQVDDGDHELLAEALTEVVQGQWKSQRGAASATQLHKNQGIDAHAAQLAAAYQAVLAERFGR